MGLSDLRTFVLQNKVRRNEQKAEETLVPWLVVLQALFFIQTVPVLFFFLHSSSNFTPLYIYIFLSLHLYVHFIVLFFLLVPVRRARQAQRGPGEWGCYHSRTSEAPLSHRARGLPKLFPFGRSRWCELMNWVHTHIIVVAGSLSGEKWKCSPNI